MRKDYIAYISPDTAAQLLVENRSLVGTGLTSGAYEQEALSAVELQFGAQPETTETGLLGTESVTLRTFHFALNGSALYALVIIAGRNDVGTELALVARAGNTSEESSQRFLFDAISAGFVELGFH